MSETASLPRAAASGRGRSPWLDRAMIAVFVALVALPLLFGWPSQERLRWQAAARLADYEQQADPRVLAELVKLTQALPNDSALRLRVVEILVRQNEVAQAAALIEPLLREVDDSTRPLDLPRYRVLREHANVQWLRGEDEASVQTIRQLQRQIPDELRRSDTFVNELAYQRALAQIELPEAEQDMYAMIFRRRVAMNPHQPRWLSFRTSVVVACAMIAVDLKRGEQVLPILDREVQDARLTSAARTGELFRTVHDQLGGGDQLIPDEARESLDQLRQFEAQARCDLASVLLARAYVLDQMQQRAASQRDRREAAALDVDGDAWLAAVPGHAFWLDLLERGSSYLDTYAFILHGRSRPWPALHEQQLAILAAELFCASYQSPLQNTPELSQSLPVLEGQARHALAVLYAHQAEMFSAVGDSEREEQAWQRIEALGYDRDVILF